MKDVLNYKSLQNLIEVIIDSFNLFALREVYFLGALDWKSKNLGIIAHFSNKSLRRQIFLPFVGVNDIYMCVNGTDTNVWPTIHYKHLFLISGIYFIVFIQCIQFINEVIVESKSLVSISPLV